jgi:hypothetical protein
MGISIKVEKIVLGLSGKVEIFFALGQIKKHIQLKIHIQLP